LQRILDECGLLACAMYIDLNPIRARLAETPETSRFTSVYERIMAQCEENQPRDDASQDKTNGQSSDVAGAQGPRDAWLSPVELGNELEGKPTGPMRRASNRGYLPMTFAEYLSLLDWTGREIRSDKRGSIPAELSPIFERLRINAEVWVEAVRNFGRWFRTAAGRVDSLMHEAKRRGRRYLQGERHSRLAFN